MGMSAMGHKRTFGFTDQRRTAEVKKRLIGRLSNTTERNCTYDRDGDCPNACKDEGSHDRWLDQDIP
jgi:hypothetical protein